jgi:hypothetical protein
MASTPLDKPGRINPSLADVQFRLIPTVAKGALNNIEARFLVIALHYSNFDPQ